MVQDHVHMLMPILLKYAVSEVIGYMKIRKYIHGGILPTTAFGRRRLAGSTPAPRPTGGRGAV